MVNVADALERLRKLETGIVSDVLDEAGVPRHSLSPSIKPLQGNGCIAGKILTVRGRKAVKGAHAKKVISVDDIERDIDNNTIVLMDTGQFNEGAALGGFVADEFKKRGCHGIILDGCIRDIEEIRHLGLPLYAAGVTPVNGSRRWQWVEVGETISMPGQDGTPLLVNSGDYVIADQDGVVVIPQAHIQQIMEDSEELYEIEGRIRTAMASGASRSEAFKKNPRFSHVRKVS
ncbi:RraA family protein [Aquibaculum sediminis]|uniref:RraA family protein n=1 Tax=Aquibaculum sediminis TaxID=3231907 RepID=UPI0034550257